jgi:3-methyladenine DNA glycosylase AlkD
MNTLILQICEDLKALSDEDTRLSGMRFFKEQVAMYGVKSGDVRNLIKGYLSELKSASKSEIFSLCEQLWQSGRLEETFVACELAYSRRKTFVPDDFKMFESWVEKYINNWASCDTFCNHTVGDFVMMYPEFLSSLQQWALSPNRWLRRAAAVSLIVPARKGLFLPEIKSIALALLTDLDDMVQKGYGWMLKVASQVHQDEVFNFVMEHKAVMPRTALRYAIEKMPKALKEKAMAKP